MSALAMILATAMVIPRDGPDKVAGELTAPQRLDLKGCWKAIIYRKGRAVINGEAYVEDEQFRLVNPRNKQRSTLRLGRVIDEGSGKLQIGQCLGIYRQDGDRLSIYLALGGVRVRPTSFQDRNGLRRAHVLLLLDDGLSYRDVRAFLYASNDLLADCIRRFRKGGIHEALESNGTPATPPDSDWLPTIMDWPRDATAQDFGYFRQRWTCAMLAEVLAWEKDIHVSAETVRRARHRAGYVWRRPRPVLGPTDPEYTGKIQGLSQLMATLPDDETVVFEDEVAIQLNPKIGSCWMPRGQQCDVVTPRNNEKRHLAGSLHWRTGMLLISEPGRQRNAALFVAHLDDLRFHLRSYRRIHVVCDNARFHDCHAVWDYLKRLGNRIVFHFLPKYAPQANPIERV